MNTMLRLPCSVEVSSNSNITVTWYQDGQVLQADNTHIVLDNGTLEITDIVEGSDATVEGLVYFCVVSNEIGSIISRSALIQYACEYEYIECIVQLANYQVYSVSNRMYYSTC